MNSTMSVLLLTTLFFFLLLTNPTTDEYTSWYVTQVLADAPDGVFEQAVDLVGERLITETERTDYLICSVFTFRGRQVLGIGQSFFPAEPIALQPELLQVEWKEVDRK